MPYLLETPANSRIELEQQQLLTDAPPRGHSDITIITTTTVKLKDKLPCKKIIPS